MKQKNDDARGEKLVKRIDELLELRGEKRQVLYDKVGISLQSISNWKSQDRLPSVDSALQIANYFEVSLEWLINGKITFSGNYDTSPSSIYSRIYFLLECEHQGKGHTMPLEQFHKPISHIVSNTLLINWRDNRIVPEPQKLIEIAKYFRQSYAFIVTGDSFSIQQEKNADGDVMLKDEYELFRQYKKYEKIIWDYDSLFETDKIIVDELIRRMAKTRKLIENRDEL